MHITPYKNYRLMHNPYYPLDFSHKIVDQWEQASKDEDFAGQIENIEKRSVLPSPVFECNGVKFLAKYYRTRGIKRIVEALLYLPESIRNFSTAIHVERRGLLTSRPLCLWGDLWSGPHSWSVLFMEDLGKLPKLTDFLNSIPPDDEKAKRRISILLARALAGLHEAGVYVRDPSKNILLDDKGNRILFYFIDFDSVIPYRPLTLRRIARVLQHCIRPPGRVDMFTDEERVLYIKEYLRSRSKQEWFDTLLYIV